MIEITFKEMVNLGMTEEIKNTLEKFNQKPYMYRMVSTENEIKVIYTEKV